MTDNSSTGANAFVGTLNNANPQQLDNLAAEYSVSANDTPQRLAAADSARGLARDHLHDREGFHVP